MKKSTNLLNLPYEIFITHIFPHLPPYRIPQIAFSLTIRLEDEDYSLLGDILFSHSWNLDGDSRSNFRRFAKLSHLIEENPVPPPLFSSPLNENEYSFLGQRYFGSAFEKNRLESSEETYDYLCGYTEIRVTPELINLTDPEITTNFEEHIGEIIEWYTERAFELSELYNVRVEDIYGILTEEDTIEIHIQLLGHEEKLKKKDPSIIEYFVSPEERDEEEIFSHPLTLLDYEWGVLGNLNRVSFVAR